MPVSQQKDLHLITQNTPNGKKVQIALEEMKAMYGLDYSYEVIDITTGIQKEDWFLCLNPNGRIPTLVDNKVDNGSSEPFAIMESGAQLLYLAKKVDKDDAFGFKDDLERSECLQWIFWQMGGQGPMQGQSNHFHVYAPEKIPYAIKRYHDELFRLMDVMEAQFSGRFTGREKDYLAGNGRGKYSWADMAAYPWAIIAKYSGLTQEELDQMPHVQKWIERIKARPAVQSGCSDKYGGKSNPEKVKAMFAAQQAKH